MHEHVLVDCPHAVAEALERVKFAPLARLCLVNLELHIFTHSVGSATQHQHQSSHEDRGVLVSRQRLFHARLVGGFDPVPAAVSVSSETPGVFECRLIGSPATESDHHAGRTSLGAQGGRVVRTN